MLTRALLCAACALAVTATPAHATFPGQNGKIVFTHFDDADDESTADIYTMSPNGRHLRNLTPNSPADDDFPSWSADGRMIAFWSTRTGPDNPTRRPRDLRDERQRIRAAAGHVQQGRRRRPGLVAQR